MIYRDLYCRNCGIEVKDVPFESVNDKITIKCKNCNIVMENLCRCGSFELKYDNKKDMCGWSADNYNSSQYYKK
jgi:hypothetical protein